MNFEKFIATINSDDVYRETVKSILENNPYAIHDAPDYLKDKEELLLFGARLDMVSWQHINSRLKKDKEFLLEFTRYNYTTPILIDDSLKEDREFVLSLINENHKTLTYLDSDYVLGLKS